MNVRKKVTSRGKASEANARTLSTILTGVDSSVPTGSLLEAAIKQNPRLGATLRRQRLSAEQQDLLSEILLSPKDMFGERDRKVGKMTMRLGTMLRERLNRFFSENPLIKRERFVELAIHRLLEELGE